MYISKDGAKVDVLFGSETLNDLLNNVSLINYIARFDKNLLNDLKHEKISLDYKKRRVKIENANNGSSEEKFGFETSLTK